MFIFLFCYVTVINFCLVLSHIDDVHRNKRSDDYVPCEKGWFYFRDKCYKAIGQKPSERLSWHKALARCKRLGADLVSIQSQEEQDFIVSFLQLDVKYWTWIGLNDLANESDYMWTDGTVFEYTNWNAMEPTGFKDEKEDCVHMLFHPQIESVGKWNDKACDATDAYICEMNANPTKRSPNLMYCSSQDGGGWKYENSCYHVITETKSWQDAEKHCKKNFNGHLVTIRNVLVNLFLDYILANLRKDMWIGIKMEDQFQQRWTSGWYVSYNIYKDELIFKEESCFARDFRRRVFIISCSKKLSFICEVSKETVPALKPAPRGAHCPTDLREWRDLGGEYCYYIEKSEPCNFYEATFGCRRRGGELVILHSREEAEILRPFLQYFQNNFYIGLVRLLTNEETFTWSDGSSISYENWNHHEPNSEDEKCVEVVSLNMGWNDCDCESKKGFICSVKKIMPNTSFEQETDSCAGYVPLKALIGVSICIILVLLLLGIVVYYFRPSGSDYRKNSTASSAPPSPSTNRPRYRSDKSTTELKEDDPYESMM